MWKPNDYSDTLPFEPALGFSRSVQIQSGVLRPGLVRVRGELADDRSRYEDASDRIAVHGVVIELDIDTETAVIEAARFALPMSAFPGLCDALPVPASALVGVSIQQGLSRKIMELYGRQKSCFHVYSLLMSMVPALPQCVVWNGKFRDLDTEGSLELVPLTMKNMARDLKDSCHAWGADSPVQRGHAAGRFGPTLKRVAPRLHAKWAAGYEGPAESFDADIEDGEPGELPEDPGS